MPESHYIYRTRLHIRCFSNGRSIVLCIAVMALTTAESVVRIYSKETGIKEVAYTNAQWDWFYAALRGPAVKI